MSKHSPPIVPFVLYIADQRHPWRLAEVERLGTRYHTPTTVALEFGTIDSSVRPQAGKKGISKQQGQVHCLPDEAAWERAQAERAALQQAIDALADGLRGLGSYASRLEEAGGIKQAPNPLTPTVIYAPDPDHTPKNWTTTRPLPQITRRVAISHTAKLLRCRGYHPETEVPHHQRDHFVCPTDADWEQILALHRGAQEAEKKWKDLLHRLGTYFGALADGRYRQPVTIPRLDMRVPIVETPAPLPSHPPNWPQLAAPLFYGHHRNAGAGGIVHAWRPEPRPRSKQRHQAVCAIVQTETPKAPDWSAHPRLCGLCRRKLTAEAPTQEQPTLKEEQPMNPVDIAHNLPPKLAGWRWATNAVGAYLIAPDGDWQTKAYTYTNRAISEALRRVNSEPKPEPAQKVTPTPATTAPQIVALSTAQIRTDGGTQSRAELHQQTVEEYAEAMQAGAHFPPVVVYYDGETYWLADGFHRVAAARQLKAMVQAEVRQGTRRDAVLEACAANANHGLRRTNADKRRAVETLLRDEEWRQWSDREVARRAGVHHELVGRVRGELGLTGGIRQSSDGRTMDTTGISQANAARAEAHDADEPKTDAGRVSAIRRYLEQQRQAGRLTNPATYNTACDMASAIHDGETYRRVIREIGDAALPPGVPALPPAPWASQDIAEPVATPAAADPAQPAQSVEPIPPELEAHAKATGLNVWVNRLDGGYSSANAIGIANYQDHATLADLEAYINARPARAKSPAPDPLAPDRQALLIARTHLDVAIESASPAQIRQQISDARKQLYQVGDGLLAPQRAALEAEAARILAELDGREVPASDRVEAPIQVAAPAPYTRPPTYLDPSLYRARSDARGMLEKRLAPCDEVLIRLLAQALYQEHRLVDVWRDDLWRLRAFIGARLFEELHAADPDRALRMFRLPDAQSAGDDPAADRHTMDLTLRELEAMVLAGNLNADQVAGGVATLEQLDGQYNELLSDMEHQQAQAYSDRMDRLQAAFESAEQQETLA